MTMFLCHCGEVHDSAVQGYCVVAVSQRIVASLDDTTPHIHCPQCRGSGRIPLHPALADVFARCQGEWQSTKAINASFPFVKPTALINRLQELRRLGLVENRFDPANAKRLEWRLKAAAPVNAGSNTRARSRSGG